MKLSKRHTKPHSAFTIVELLVVTVIIAILATITLVTYSNISNQAVVSSLKTDLSNASKLLKMEEVANAAFPATLAEVNNNKGVPASPGTTYQYIYNNSASPKMFCITATNGSTSYRITSNANPALGTCQTPGIVTNGLILSLDATNTASYPGSGTGWTDLSGNNNHGTLVNGPTYSSADGGSILFDGSNDYVSSTQNGNYVDVTIAFKPDFTSNTTLAGIIASGTSTDKSMRFMGVNGVGPWTLASRNPGDANDWAYSTATTYYINGNVSNDTVSGWNILSGYRTNQTTFPANFAYHLGTAGYAGRYFKGNIAAVFMYNRALTAPEVSQNFNALRSRYGL